MPSSPLASARAAPNGVTALGFNAALEASQALVTVAARSTGMVRDFALWWLFNEKDSPWPTASVNAALKARGLFDPNQVSLYPSIVPEAGPTALRSAAEIVHGDDGVAVDLTDGARTHGRLLTPSDPVMIQPMGGLTQLVPAARIKCSPRKPLGRSVMLSAEPLGLSTQDIADIVTYPKTL